MHIENQYNTMNSWLGQEGLCSMEKFCDAFASCSCSWWFRQILEIFCSFLFCPGSTAFSSLAQVYFAINTPLSDAAKSFLVAWSCTVRVEVLGVPHTDCQVPNAELCWGSVCCGVGTPGWELWLHLPLGDQDTPVSCLEFERTEDAKVPAELRRQCGSQGNKPVIVVAVKKAHGSSF